ncbi:MAG: PP2C family protein-serine/threonine phosphatase [Luminiphilus sp.]
MSTSVVSGCGATHCGKRSHNEDAFFVDDELGLYVVADGVGGQDAGEIASNIVCQVLPERIRAGVAMADATQEAHFAIANAISKGEGKPGMASTVVALLVRNDLYEVAWLGDSRVYVWDGHLKLLSRDHSMVETLLASGEIDLDQAQNHPKKNIILAALGGGDANINVGQNGGVLRSGTRFLLCSDGLTDIVGPKRISEVLNSIDDTCEACETLVAHALEGQGRDNITAIVVDVVDAPVTSDEPDEHAQVVHTYDPEKNVYTYHREDRVLVSSKVRRLAPNFQEQELSGKLTERALAEPSKPAQVPWGKSIVLACIALAMLLFITLG